MRYIASSYCFIQSVQILYKSRQKYACISRFLSRRCEKFEAGCSRVARDGRVSLSEKFPLFIHCIIIWYYQIITIVNILIIHNCSEHTSLFLWQLVASLHHTLRYFALVWEFHSVRHPQQPTRHHFTRSECCVVFWKIRPRRCAIFSEVKHRHSLRRSNYSRQRWLLLFMSCICLVIHVKIVRYFAINLRRIFSRSDRLDHVSDTGRFMQSRGDGISSSEHQIDPNDRNSFTNLVRNYTLYLNQWNIEISFQIYFKYINL